MKLLRVLPALLLPLSAFAAEKGPLPVAALKRSDPVNFDREILPFLSENCLSCHCKTTTKGGLNLETPELMLKGGEGGPAVVPGKAAESLAFQAAIHKDADLAMPPRDNKAKAKNLTPEQLALLQLWIDQGAKPSPKTERIVQWQPLPAHLNPIFAAAITGDGQFAACSRANRFFIYQLPAQRCVFQAEAHRDQINAAAFSPDGTLAATGSYREVKLWRRQPALLYTMAGGAVAPAPDGRLAVWDAVGTLSAWKQFGSTPTRLPNSEGAITAAAFALDGSALATAAGKVLSVRAEVDQPALKSVEAAAEIRLLAWTAEKIIATADGSASIQLWSGELARAKQLNAHKGAVTALASAGPGRIISGSADGIAYVWDVTKGEPALKLVHGVPITAVAYRPDGQRFATAGENGIVKLWNAVGNPAGDATGNRLVAEAAAAKDRALQVETGTVAFRKGEIANAEKAVTAAKDHVKKSEDVLGTKAKDLEAKKAALAKAQEEKKAADQGLADAKAEVAKTAAEPESPAAKAAAAKEKAATDKIAPAEKKVADAQLAIDKAEGDRKAAENAIAQAKAEIEKTTGEVGKTKAAADAAEVQRKKAEEAAALAKKEIPAAVKPVRAVAFTADSRLLVSGGDGGIIQTWNAENAAPLEVIAAEHGKIQSLTAASGGAVVLSGGEDGKVKAWELAPQWTLERTIGTSAGKSPLTDRVNAVAFSRDGKLLATGSGEPSRTGEIKLWNVATGQLVRDLPNFHVDSVLALEFSPDDKYLATGAADKVSRVIDLSTGKTLRSFEGHTHHVLGVAWSLDGRTLATSGADNVVKIWNVLTGDRIKNIDGYEKEVTTVRFTGATTTLLTSSGDNKVRLVSTAGAEVRTLPVPEFMATAAVTADGQTIVAGGQDGVLRVWNAADGKALATFEK